MFISDQIAQFTEWASEYEPARRPDRHVTPVLLYSQRATQCTVCLAPAAAAIFLEKKGVLLCYCEDHLRENEDIL